MAEYQSLKNKKGEIVFRRNLYKDFSSLSVMELNLESRIKEEVIHQRNSREAYRCLKKKNIPITPYVDLGAGSCLRSLVLENEFQAKGIAGDISFAALNFAPVLAKDLGYKKVPFRVVLDIYHLPFKNDSLPFITVFQTLHHLPDPLPVLKEIKRVLANNGYVYIGEEPIKQTLNLRLWRRGRKRTFLEKFLMAIGILPFITTIGKEEVENGILEESFSLRQWQEWLSIFNKVEAKINPFKLGPGSKNLYKTPFLTKFFLFLLGGGINALCKTIKTSPPVEFTDLTELFACPECNANSSLRLIRDKDGYLCPECKSIYPIKDGILFLLPKKLRKKLYPNL